MVHLIDKSVYDFEIGDLVRLSEDIKIQIGYGLVADIKNNFDDVYDMEYLTSRIKSLSEILYTKDNEFFPSSPQILVLWSGKTLISENLSIWMYASELTIVQKVVKDTK